jgi:hypothetical protein
LISLRPYQFAGIASIREAFGALRKAAQAAYHAGYLRGHVLRCKRLRERMAVEVKRVV